MYISKKNQAILDAFETEKEKQDYLAELRKNVARVKRAYREKNAENIKEVATKWRKANPDTLRIARQKRKAKEFEEIKQYFR